MTDTNVPTITRHSVIIIAVVVASAALYWLRDILTPLALAVFLTIMVDSFVRVLHERARMPKRFALPSAIVFSLILFGGSIYVIADNGAAFITQLLGYGPRLTETIGKAAALFGMAVPPTMGQLLQQLNPGRYVAPVLQGLQGFAANALFVMVYMGFMFASRQGFRRKMVALFPHHDARNEAVHVFERIRNSVEQYLWIQTVTGLIIGAGSWVVMAMLQLENAVFFAFLIFIICYIPVVGGAVAIFLPPLYALMQFPSFAPAIILLASLGTINFVVGNILLPRMQGETLNMDPIVVLLSLALWTAIWGLPGAFLSTPLTGTAMIILAQFPRSRWMAVLLSGNGDPLADGRQDRGPPEEKRSEKTRPAGRSEETTQSSQKRDDAGVKPKSRSPI
jgi:AI-2 transport protein TqsA